MKQYEKRGRFSFIGMEGMSFLLFHRAVRGIRTETMAALTHDIREQKIPIRLKDSTDFDPVLWLCVQLTGACGYDSSDQAGR